MISEFRIENMQVSAFLICLLVFVLGGLLTGLRHFNQLDSMYLRLTSNDDTVKGVEILKAGETWNYKNLVNQNEDSDNLVIRNELFWFEGDEISAAKLNECFKMVMGDFQRLQKDIVFKNYAAGKKVTIRVFDNTGSDVPLVERTL